MGRSHARTACRIRRNAVEVRKARDAMSARSGNGEGVETVKEKRTESVKSASNGNAQSSAAALPENTLAHRPHGAANFCTATARQSGRRCRRIVGEFATVCSNHGGSAPQVRNAARKRQMLARAAAEVQARGFNPVTDPAELLMRLAGESEALKSALAAKVTELSTANLVHVDRDGRENLSALLGAYREALRDTVSVTEKLIRLDVSARTIDLPTEQGRLVVECLNAAVYDPEAGLTAEQCEAVMAAMAREVRSRFGYEDAEEPPDAD